MSCDLLSVARAAMRSQLGDGHQTKHATVTNQAWRSLSRLELRRTRPSPPAAATLTVAR
jgi:hypothetical protein